MEQKTTETTATTKTLKQRLIQWIAQRTWQGKAAMVITLVAVLLFAFSERSLVITHACIALRKYGALTLLVSLLIFGWYRLIARTSKTTANIMLGSVITITVIMLLVLPWFFKMNPLGDAYAFVSSYVRYQTLDQVTLASLPETDCEAMQSKVSIHTTGEQELQQNEQISTPHRVRIGDRYPWTMAKEPIPLMKYAESRLTDGIKKVYCIPAEVSSLDFSKQNQSDVDFAIGETLLLGEEAEIAVMRALPMSYLLNTEVGEPRFMKDDQGQWVQVYPLVRWQGTGFLGIFFPQPEFGGVQVIKQTDGHVSMLFITQAFWKRAFFGAGTTYTPDQMKHIPYLNNQNLLPRKIKEAIAQSFRFQKGFTAPMTMSHDGDTRIPDVDIPELDVSMKSLPVTAYFKMSQVANYAKDMLYDYYGLEPHDSAKSGLTVSLYIPSDGTQKVYVYRHVDDAISGMSAVPGSARESAKQYDWNQSKIADVRPYTKMVNGKIQHMWLFSVVTHAKSRGYTSGSASDVGLLDPVKKRVYWLSPDSTSSWMMQIQ